MTADTDGSSTCAGIVLAAEDEQRFGMAKALGAWLADRPRGRVAGGWVRARARFLGEAGPGTGPSGVEVVGATRWQEGTEAPLRAGLDQYAGDGIVASALIALVDTPGLTAAVAQVRRAGRVTRPGPSSRRPMADARAIPCCSGAPSRTGSAR